MPTRAPLPIDAFLPEIVRTLANGANVLLHAPPGAGKTTRVPPAMLEAGLVGDREIVVLEPRRIAARMAARRVAHELGENVGARAGYSVRFESCVSAYTKIRFVTEGVLMRSFRDDSGLSSVAAVIFDEFHERHLEGDLALALVRRLQRCNRPDLRIVVMSATLPTGRIESFLDAKSISCPGRVWPVDIEHAEHVGDRDDKALVRQVVAGLRQCVARAPDGHILVFLPGAREIRMVAQACESIASRAGLEVLPLHGDLAPDAQDRVVAPSARAKLILTTNVAETSITIDGVTAVIDSGLARVPSFDVFSGRPTLDLVKISRASALQRAGRAGRTAPGRCLRLYTRRDFEHRPEHHVPDVQRLDLASTLLELRTAGVHDLAGFEWFEPPSLASIDAAERLLLRLGATTAVGGALTQLGRHMAAFPLHPRHARVLLEGARRGATELGATVAALLSERPLRREVDEGLRHACDADVVRDAEAVLAGEVDRMFATRIHRAKRQLLELMQHEAPTMAKSALSHRSEPVDVAIRMALLHGFPDRVARMRNNAGAGATLVLCGGGSAILGSESGVHAELLVAIDLEQRRQGGVGSLRVRSAVAIEPEWLLDAFPERISEHTRWSFDADAQRVVGMSELRYDDLVLDATVARAFGPEAAAVLRDAALAADRSYWLNEPKRLDLLLDRVRFAAKHSTELGVLTDADVKTCLRELCEDRTSFAELREVDLVRVLEAKLTPEQRRVLVRFAPMHVELASGRTARVHYPIDGSPYVESWLQDFYGTTSTPTIADGRVSLVVHLLAPNRRPVQITTDLASFWTKHYPELRKALSRRYPKHAWPEDPIKWA